jgi:hypothetical protein
MSRYCNFEILVILTGNFGFLNLGAIRNLSCFRLPREAGNLLMDDSLRSRTRKHFENVNALPRSPSLLQSLKKSALNLAGKVVDIFNGSLQFVSNA